MAINFKDGVILGMNIRKSLSDAIPNITKVRIAELLLEHISPTGSPINSRKSTIQFGAVGQDQPQIHRQWQILFIIN